MKKGISGFTHRSRIAPPTPCLTSSISHSSHSSYSSGDQISDGDENKGIKVNFSIKTDLEFPVVLKSLHLSGDKEGYLIGLFESKNSQLERFWTSYLRKRELMEFREQMISLLPLDNNESTVNIQFHENQQNNEEKEERRVSQTKIIIPPRMVRTNPNNAFSFKNSDTLIIDVPENSSPYTRKNQNIAKERAKANASIEDFDLEMLIKEYDPKKGFSEKLKKNLAMYSQGMTYQEFVGSRHLLGIDDVELFKFIMEIKGKIIECFPPDKNVSHYNPGLTLEQYVEVCQIFNYKLDKLFYSMLVFYYLDFNNNGLLEMEELLLGLLLMGSENEKVKIEAAFAICDRDGFGSLSFSELSNYLRLVIRAGQGKQASGDYMGLSPYEFEVYINKMSKSLALNIFKDIGHDLNSRISLEEFLLWHSLLEAEQAGYSERARHITKTLKSNNSRRREIIDSRGNQKSLEFLENLRTTFKTEFLDFTEFVSKIKSFANSKSTTCKEFLEFLTWVYSSLPTEQQLIGDEIKDLADFVFRSMDTCNHGILNWDEIVTCFSILIPEDESEKLRIVFEEFSFVTKSELDFKELFFFVKSVFGFMIANSTNDAIKDEEAEKLAFLTVLKCFKDNSVSIHEVISFGRFKRWYSTSL